MAHSFCLGEESHEVWLARCNCDYVLHLGQRRLAVALRDRGDNAQELTIDGSLWPVYVAVHGDNIHIHLDGEAHTLTYSHDLKRFGLDGQDRSDTVSRAPMPGAVVALTAQVGQVVRRGDVLVVIESMKMETAVCAAIDGVVECVHVQQGQTFERDALLVSLSSVESA